MIPIDIVYSLVDSLSGNVSQNKSVKSRFSHLTLTRVASCEIVLWDE